MAGLQQASPGPLFSLPTAGLPLPAAKADPKTSHAAARAVVASGERDRHVLVVARLVAMYPGRTSRELACTSGAVEVGLDRHEAARRLPEAEAVGLVKRGAVRQCRESMRAALTWLPVEQGGKSECETDP